MSTTTGTPAEPKTIETIRTDAYADGKLSNEELRAIAAEVMKDGVTKDELKQFEQDFKKALLDATTVKEKAEVAATGEMVMGTQKLLKTFMYFVGAVLAIVILSSLIQGGQLFSLLMTFLGSP